MKNIFKIALTALLCAVVFGGCEKREILAGTGGHGDRGDGIGYLVFAGSGVSVEFDGERVSDSGQGDPTTPTTRAAENPDVDEFWVEIVAEDGSIVGEPFKYKDRGEEPIAVAYGTYTVRAYSGDKYKVEGDVFWENDADASQPSWGGEQTVTIEAENTEDNPKQVDTITCKMQTVKVTLVLEQALAARFNADKTEIRVVISDDNRYNESNPGNHTATYTNDLPHQYGLAEMDTAHTITKMERESTVSYMNTVAEEGNAMFVYIKTKFKDDDEMVSERDLELTIDIAEKDSGVQPGQWRKISLFLSAVNEETGRIVIGATIEDWVYDAEVTVDNADAVAELGERVIKDIDPSVLRMSSSDFDIRDGHVTEISSYDSAGNFTGSATLKIENNSGEPVERFRVNISSQNSGFANFLQNNKMNDVWVDMLEFSDARSTLKGWGFPVLGERNEKTISFDLKNLMDYLYDYPGRHDVSVAVVCGEYYYRADLNLNVVLSSGGDVGGNDGPGGDSGEAPSIVWVDHDIDKRYDVTDDLQVQVKVTAPAGIKEFMVEIDGALKDDLESVGLVEKFSLVSPEQYKEGLGKSLKGLGFPVGSEVENKTEVGFDISDFMVLLGSFYGNNDFKLTVTDNNGQTISKTVMLYVKE